MPTTTDVQSEVGEVKVCISATILYVTPSAIFAGIAFRTKMVSQSDAIK